MPRKQPPSPPPSPPSPPAWQVRHDVTRFSEQDLYLFNEGTHFQLHHRLGSHVMTHQGQSGVYFAVWAPNADRVFVCGDFNHWRQEELELWQRGLSGIWEGFVPGLGAGALYKYRIHSRVGGHRSEKADPFAARHEVPPLTASVVWPLDYEWGDDAWLESRRRRDAMKEPMSIYEVHLGSWMRDPADPDRFLSYRELAPRLAEYATRLGFTHVELLPVMEHPFYASWGYQTTGYFAPTSRYGPPEDFMLLVDTLHQAGVAVILDWVPSHFPSDHHGLAYFDGTHLFEHADPRQGFHPDWRSFIFNYGRNEVRAFLLSSAYFWLDVMHVDGLRVDAVASMLYLDYSRKPGEWIPNRFGGNENLDAVEFLRRFNAEVYQGFPGCQTIAEESTAWPMVSRPTYLGGLGFGFKWDMGWMHDTLFYFSRDPIYRRFHHGQLTFRMLYAFTENFVLPLSHDEVVHGKGSLIGKLPGDMWQKFANLRLLLGYMWAQPGKKLLFMGGEIGQWREWNHDASLDWHLLDHPSHAGVQRWVADLNRAYRAEPALHRHDCAWDGFEWIDCNDSDASVLTFIRRGGGQTVLAACNFTPVPRHGYRVGAPLGGFWREMLNSDASDYAGSGVGNAGGVMADDRPLHGRPHSLSLTLPPLAIVMLRHEG
ncbi:MAG: 1,4-alpha-glucan branching protein GlgB [Thermodesulfobacteriota bacterium]